MPLFSRLLRSLGGAGPVPAVEGDLVERLCLYDWPFNVRELVFLVRRLLALHGTGTTLRAHHLPARIADGSGGTAPAGPATAPQAPAEPVQLPALVAALRTSGGNVARAAGLLGISRQRAYRLMEGQSIDLDALRGEDKP